MNYKTLKDTDLFTFFNIHEFESPRSSPFTINLKPGGFQEHIDLELSLNKDRDIEKAILILDRKWIGNEESINPFGKDLAKSFIDTFLPVNPESEFKEALITSLWNLKGKKDRIICIDKVIQAWESSNLDVKQFLDVYRGNLKDAKKGMDFGYISMENLEIQNKNRLKIIIQILV